MFFFSFFVLAAAVFNFVNWILLSLYNCNNRQDGRGKVSTLCLDLHHSASRSLFFPQKYILSFSSSLLFNDEDKIELETTLSHRSIFIY